MVCRDGLEHRIGLVAVSSLVVEPQAETALVQSERWWIVAFAIQVFFHGDNPGAMFDTGKKERQVVTVERLHMLAR